MRGRNVNVPVRRERGIKYSKGAFSLDIFTTKQSVPNTIILFILFVVLNPGDLVPSQTEEKYTRRTIK